MLLRFRGDASAGDAVNAMDPVAYHSLLVGTIDPSRAPPPLLTPLNICVGDGDNNPDAVGLPSSSAKSITLLLGEEVSSREFFEGEDIEDEDEDDDMGCTPIARANSSRKHKRKIGFGDLAKLKKKRRPVYACVFRLSKEPHE